MYNVALNIKAPSTHLDISETEYFLYHKTASESAQSSVAYSCKKKCGFKKYLDSCGLEP